VPGSPEPVLSKCRPEEGTRRTDLDVSAPNPTKVPPKNLRFRDLKKDWDKSLQRTGNQASDMYVRRYGETPEEFKAARATPFENLKKEETVSATAL
jgi:hypothetical protein